jgi:NIMA (never in mitosis gene a)-related kinase
VWRDEPYTFVSDVWSAGCVLFEVLALKPPFQANDLQALFKKVLKGTYQKIPRHYSQDLSLFLKLMLQVKPENRPSCSQLTQMPTFIKKAKYFFPHLVANYQILD